MSLPTIRIKLEQPPLSATPERPSEEPLAPTAATATGEAVKTKKKRLLSGLDLGVLEQEGGRASKRRVVEEAQAAAASHAPQRFKQASVVPERSAEEVQADGQVLWRTLREVTEGDRVISVDFLRLPPKKLYPDYYDIIKRPMCLEDVKSKLDRNVYTSLEAVRDDLKLIFSNARKYNQAGSSIYEDAKYLQRLLESRYNILTGRAEVDDEKLQRLRKEKIPTLKNYLMKKVEAMLYYVDQSGRPYSEYFRELPSPELYQDYYRVITQPMAFDVVQGKIKKRSYATAEAFSFDVDLIFANAKYYNEESSRVWKDAAVLEKYFAELMNEPVPDFAALAAEAERKEKEGMKLKISLGGGGTASISAVPEPVYSGKIKLKLGGQAHGGDAQTPLGDIDASMRGQSPAYFGSQAVTPSAPTPPAPTPAPLPPPPRIIRARVLAGMGGNPVLSSIIVRAKPSGPVVELSMAKLRQHAIVIPRTAESIEIVPVGVATLRGAARPHVAVSSMVEAPHGRTVYVLRPPPSMNMTTFEVFARPKEGAGGEEVYRVFLQRLPM